MNGMATMQQAEAPPHPQDVGWTVANEAGLGDEARGSFNQFADSLGDKIAGRNAPHDATNNRNTEIIAEGQRERAEGRAEWDRASAHGNAATSSTTAPGTAPGATTTTGTGVTGSGVTGSGVAGSGVTGSGVTGASNTTY